MTNHLTKNTDAGDGRYVIFKQNRGASPEHTSGSDLCLQKSATRSSCWMRAGRYEGLALGQQLFEFLDQFRFQNVFDRVCVAVDMARGDVSLSNEIQLPQAVVAHSTAGFAGAGLSQMPALLGVHSDHAIPSSPPDELIHSMG